MNADTLRRAIMPSTRYKYSGRTEMGLAPTGYWHTEEYPIHHGTGQGTANSPAIWCFLSWVHWPIAMTRWPLKLPIAKLQAVSRWRWGWWVLLTIATVKRILSTEVSCLSVPHLVQQIQQNPQPWTDMLYASGSTLELSKCSCHIIQRCPRGTVCQIHLWLPHIR